ncbi:MAG TPA: LuxR C-terminal-related transcriptional regulator [Anaerolineales bacterium]|nr:LuxR C-terminal-related transcriptional regulator [Anaerolineales bacterium]
MPENPGPGPTELRAEPEANPLSEREIEILKLVASGAANKEIAAQLVISPNTVKVHVRNIFAKIGVQSRTEAAVYAIKHGIVSVSNEAPTALPIEPIDGDPGGALSTPTAGDSVEPQQRQWLMPAMLVAALVVFAIAAWRLLSPTPAPVAAPTFDPVAIERWVRHADLPTAVSAPAVAAYENQIFVIGGEAADGPTAALWRYDPTAATWAAQSPKPTAVTDSQAVVVGGRIYVPGGRDSTGAVVRALEIYNPRTDTWEIGADLPAPRSGYALVALEGKVLLFGGWDGSDFRSEVFEYLPDDDRWQVRTQLPTPRAYAAAAVVAGHVFVIGGADQTGPLSDTTIYIPEADAAGDTPWDTATALPMPGAYLNAATVADTILVVGGAPDGAAVAYSYNPADDAWTPLDASTDVEPRQRAGVIVLGPLLHVLGGVETETPSAQHVSYQAMFISFMPVLESGER